MRTKSIAILGLFVLCIFASNQGLQASQRAKEAAVVVATAWLALVDTGKYGESWDQAAQLFRDVMTKEQWQTTLKAVRAPLGEFMSRKLWSMEYKTSLPGVPDGEYVVIQYKTSFQYKKSAVETVTPMLDKDGRWRVSGYYIN